MGDVLRDQTVIRITLQELHCQGFNTNMMKIYMMKCASIFLQMKCEQHCFGGLGLRMRMTNAPIPTFNTINSKGIINKQCYSSPVTHPFQIPIFFLSPTFPSHPFPSRVQHSPVSKVKWLGLVWVTKGGVM